jgi:hypothetical protein
MTEEEHNEWLSGRDIFCSPFDQREQYPRKKTDSSTIQPKRRAFSGGRLGGEEVLPARCTKRREFNIIPIRRNTVWQWEH